MKIVSIEEMRQIERECAGMGLPSDILMENAGKAVAQETIRILGAIKQKNILILTGPGNNGGDGLVAARNLHDSGATVSVYLCAERKSDSNLEKVRERGITILEAAQDVNLGKLDRILASAECVIDALFGTGKARPLEGIYKQVLNAVAQARERNECLRIVALDLPSGLNADTGEVDPACVRADNTVTLGFPKPGLFIFPGAEFTGRLSIADIGIPDYLAESINLELMTPQWAKTVLPKRPLNANKGSFGKTMVAAGSINYIGAAYFACTGAIRVGAGLVTLATAASLHSIFASKLNEVTHFPLPEFQPGIVSPQAAEILGQQLGQYDTLLLGCGLGSSPSAMKFIASLLMKPELPRLVLDADALNTLSRIPSWWKELTRDAILTPHPAEMSRLAQVSIESVQSDRIGITSGLARDWQKTIVLKGAYTVIAAPDGRCRVSPVANPGLASGGTGDVLGGVIAGLLSQGLSLFDAASLGVYLHGEAGETIKDILGDTGMIASDLFSALPLVIKKLKEGRFRKEEIYVVGY